jgi:hypothetical protein
MSDTLPPELARRWGHLRFVKRHGEEWSAECPVCSDSGHDGRDAPDRFRMWLNPARAWCRRCGYQDFADSDRPQTVITEEMRQEWLGERLAREEEKQSRLSETLELLRREESWLRWHETMREQGRAWWEAKGVPAWAIDYYRLGWCESHQFYGDGGYFETPTATIPVWSQGWVLVNLRHRLINPPDDAGKYRPERAGLPASLYLTNPDEAPGGKCILVEGEIKSIVVFSRMCDDGLTVVGTPGKAFSPSLLEELRDCERVWVVFDPDAKAQAWKAARVIGDAARVVYLPVKPDDAFTQHGATPTTFREALRYGRQVA